MATSMNSLIQSSTMGRNPVTAAPTAIPISAVSEMGAGNGCNANAVSAEHLQHGVALGHGHVLTIEDYVGIALHFFDNGSGHRFSIHHFFGHRTS
jgi:hypothetical protein